MEQHTMSEKMLYVYILMHDNIENMDSTQNVRFKPKNTFKIH